MLEQYRGSESILVADDEPVVLTLTENILKMHGYGVHVAPTAQAALDIHRGVGGVDLHLTDVIMPALSGPDWLTP